MWQTYLETIPKAQIYDLDRTPYYTINYLGELIIGCIPFIKVKIIN